MSGVATAIVGSAVVGAIASDSASRRSAAAMKGSSDAAMLQANISGEQWDRYKEMYDPIERDYIKQAQEWDSPARYQLEAGAASANVTNQFGKARERLARTPGLDPSSAGFAASMAGMDMAQAGADAVAQNAARRNVQDTAWARKTDALSLGKGLPAQAMNGLSSAASSLGQIGAAQGALASNQAAAWGNLGSNLVNAGQRAGWFSGSGVDAKSLDSVGQAGRDSLSSFIEGASGASAPALTSLRL